MSAFFTFCGRMCGTSASRQSELQLKDGLKDREKIEPPIGMTEYRETEASREDVNRISQIKNEEFSITAKENNDGNIPMTLDIANYKAEIRGENVQVDRAEEVFIPMHPMERNVGQININPEKPIDITTKPEKKKRVKIVKKKKKTKNKSDRKDENISLDKFESNKENININNIPITTNNIAFQKFVPEKNLSFDLKGSSKNITFQDKGEVDHTVSLTLNPVVEAEVEIHEYDDKFSCPECEKIYRAVILFNTPHNIIECSACKNNINKHSLDFYINKYKDDIACTKSRLLLYEFGKDADNKEATNTNTNTNVEINTKLSGDGDLYPPNTIKKIKIDKTMNGLKRSPVHSHTKSSNLNDKVNNLKPQQENIINVIDEIIKVNKDKGKSKDKNNKLNTSSNITLSPSNPYRFTFGKILKKSNTEVPKKELGTVNALRKFKVSDRLVYGMKEKIPPQEIKMINKRLIQKLPELTRKLSNEDKKEDYMKRKENLKNYAKVKL